MTKFEDRMITERQGLEAMYNYLFGYYQRSKSYIIGNILGDIAMWGDGLPADPRCWSEWQRAVNKAIEESKDGYL